MKAQLSTLFCAAILLFASPVLAEQPCESGSNGDCSWTCSGGEFHVTCNNPDGPDRCYTVSNGTTCNAWCNDDPSAGNTAFGCYSVSNVNPMLSIDALSPERTKTGGELSPTGTVAPADKTSLETTRTK